MLPYSTNVMLRMGMFLGYVTDQQRNIRWFSLVLLDVNTNYFHNVISMALMNSWLGYPKKWKKHEIVKDGDGDTINTYSLKFVLKQNRVEACPISTIPMITGCLQLHFILHVSSGLNPFNEF